MYFNYTFTNVKILAKLFANFPFFLAKNPSKRSLTSSLGS
jgi:hypothetical protein